MWHHRRSMARLRQRFSDVFLGSPMLRRAAWHLQRLGRSLDRRFFLSLFRGMVVFILIAGGLVWLVEKPWTIESLFDSINWAIATILGQGDSSFVVSPAGRVIAGILILFGVAIFGTITGALVALAHRLPAQGLGQGLGASGYRDHIIVCGWNQTARDLVDELQSDAFKIKVVVLADVEKNPAGDKSLFRSGRPRHRPRISNGPASRRRRRRSSSQRRARTTPTCTRS